MRFEYITTQEVTVAEKIQQVQEGRVDMFVPLSYQAERARKGIFSKSYFASQYAAIARKGRRLSIATSADLAQYRVGFIGGVALEPILRGIVPASQLQSFDASVGSKGLFEALRADEIDLAIFNKDFFSEERYRHDLFDLEIIQNLSEYPRAYSFYFSRTPEHARVAAVFDRFLVAMDTSLSVQAHEVGERQLMERFVAQRSELMLLMGASLAAVFVALGSYLALRKQRNLSARLSASHAQILGQQAALQAANEELERLSETDGLTRLPNRRQFDKVLEREYAGYRRTKLPLSVLMIDIDHFKQVNDRYGHATGDDYLRTVGRALERSVPRTTDLVARYGGEEFACVLPDTDAGSARTVAERIRTCVLELGLPNVNADIPILTVSVGVSTLQGGDPGVQAVIASADAQLYVAKQTGRNKVCAAVLHALETKEA